MKSSITRKRAGGRRVEQGAGDEWRRVVSGESVVRLQTRLQVVEAVSRH